MKLGFVLKMITCLFFLGQCHMIAALPHLSGVKGLPDYRLKMERKQANVQETVPQWWSEDYSLPHRRRPVHNKLDP
ncbi:hypothetical protein I3843_03G044000 [Carya illinoinensis]|uniref:Uncharacterized protein n=1 Tax=Carya illinoinensis TaxID=32201 RepID=A0A8T1QWX7_CARIL|nr:hypothetical protein I3760_03G040800 [Carya illinoinensis]KAG6659610.1 hypothetical protein CIPAW_03G047700 [Carya illinoinensis]KAG6720108.1 hypothetical protein I3842_03G042600 [Carya illinoinensis]KAG7985763.1 hypothetical protein I3843_03G044000 [Carya illinoinensis]